jgi:hypothetical protein
MVTIQAFGAPMRRRIQDGTLAAYAHALHWALATRGLQRWLGVRLESLVLLVTAVTSFAAMGLLNKVGGGVQGGAVGCAVEGVCEDRVGGRDPAGCPPESCQPRHHAAPRSRPRSSASR